MNKITTIAGALALVSTQIALQNDIEVVSAEIVNVKGDGAPNGKRIHLRLQGEGIESSTRRYFLRTNSAFATMLADTGLHLGAPKMERGAKVYDLYVALTPELAGWQPPAPPKAEKVKLSPEERKQRRQDGKAAARARRASEAAAEAEAAAAA